MTHKSDEEILKQHCEDWHFLSEKLRIGNHSEVDEWAVRWRSSGSVDPAFVVHNGVLKTFSWFIVDRVRSDIRDREHAFAKSAVFDVLASVLRVDDKKSLCRDVCDSIDWENLREQIESELRSFKEPRQ